MTSSLTCRAAGVDQPSVLAWRRIRRHSTGASRWRTSQQSSRSARPAAPALPPAQRPESVVASRDHPRDGLLRCGQRVCALYTRGHLVGSPAEVFGNIVNRGRRGQGARVRWSGRLRRPPARRSPSARTLSRISSDARTALHAAATSRNSRAVTSASSSPTSSGSRSASKAVTRRMAAAKPAPASSRAARFTNGRAGRRSTTAVDG